MTGTVLVIQADFWKEFRETYLRFSYSTSDRVLAQDPLVKDLNDKLNRQELSTHDVILGPFAKVQYLSFATGLTFIEVPDNCPTGSMPEIIGWLKLQNSNGNHRTCWEDFTVEQSVQPWVIFSVQPVQFTHRWRRKVKLRCRQTMDTIRKAVR